jgi:hypothetical protein
LTQNYTETKFSGSKKAEREILYLVLQNILLHKTTLLLNMGIRRLFSRGEAKKFPGRGGARTYFVPKIHTFAPLPSGRPYAQQRKMSHGEEGGGAEKCHVLFKRTLKLQAV